MMHTRHVVLFKQDLGSKTENKRRRVDDAYVNTVVNTACKAATEQAVTIHVEDLLEQIRPKKKLSRRAKNRLEKWEKGTVKTRLTHWSQRNSTNQNFCECCVFLAFLSSQWYFVGY